VRFRDDTRGVTVQVGAVLLFATIIIALSVYQATVVPAENSDVEYRHSQQVQGQLVDVRNALAATATSGDGRPATVSLGTEYPNRVFLVNPPPAAGTLETDTYDDPSIEVSNVEATNGETRDFLSGAWAAETKSLSYVPNYNEYRDAPRLRYEASLLSNYYPDQNTSVPLTEQLVVDEQTRTVSLVALNGSLSTSRSSSVAVDPAALSAPAERVQVQPETAGDPVNVTIPTVVDASVLRNSTSLGANPNVTVTQSGPNRVTLSVDWSGPFTLRTAKVGVGSDATDPSPTYLTVVENRSDRVTVEARDAYNNPESGVTVSVDGSNPFQSGSQVTGEDGRATFVAEDGEDETATLEILGGGSAEREVEVSVDTTSGGGGNGSGGSLVYLGDGAAFDGDDDDGVPGGVSFSVQNQYASEVTITDVTVLPENGAITGLSDEAAGYGYGQSELAVSTGGEVGTVDVPLVPNEEYTYVGARGLTLSLAQNRTEDAYNTASNSFTTADTNASGTVTLSPDGTAQVSFAEFYVGSPPDTASAANVTNEDFRVVVSYERDGKASSDEYVVYADEPTDDLDVTSIVPNAGSQTQTIEFTMDSAMDQGESIEVDLSDAQSVSPDQVDYQSASASVVSGPSPSNIGFAQQSSTDAVVTYSPSSDLSAGQTITLEVTNVNAGPSSSQSNPYTVTWSRSDGGSKSTTFSVARDVGDANLQSVAASDLGSGPGQSQTLSFTPDDALEGGERVAIDLSGAQSGNVDYSNAGVNSVSTGSASKNQNDDTVYLTYTAPSGGVSSGTTVDMELSGVETTGSGSYEVGFGRARGDTASATFSAGGGGGAPLTYQTGSGSTSSPDGDGTGVEFTLENDAGQDIDIESLTVDSTTAGQVKGYVEGNGGEGQYNREAFFNVVEPPAVRVDPGDGYVESGSQIDIGETVPLDNLAQLSDGETVDVYVYQFVKNNGDAVDVSGETVTVTVAYKLADGTTDTHTFSFTA
jgi:hypothetical protein